MAHIRRLTRADVPVCRTLWMQRFGDSEAFTDWFYKKRFSPALSSCVQTDDTIISMAYGRILNMRFGKSTAPALMVAGVCTRPDYEGFGYMRAVLWSMGKLASENKCPLMVLKPVNPAIYTGLGFAVCTKAQYVTANGSALRPAVRTADAAALQRCYQTAGKGYDYMSQRSVEDMASRAEELFTDGSLLITLEDGDRVTGYAFFNPQTGVAEEMFAESVSGYHALLAGMPSGTVGRVPPDLPFGGKCRPHLMCSILDPEAMPPGYSNGTGYCADEY